MSRKKRVFRWIFLALVLAGVLGTAGLVGAVQYVFQQPAYVALGEQLRAQAAYRRETIPILAPVFDWIHDHLPPPAYRRFEKADRQAVPPVTAWQTFVGPRPDRIAAPAENRQYVTNEKAFLKALDKAGPGMVIELAPGEYRFSGRALPARRAGTPRMPIVVRAARLGTVELDFDLLEGFHVTAPYWVFENLEIEGICESDSACEHAFHIVGAADGVVLRNNWVRNFNAAIKINGARGETPDRGRIVGNTFVNDRPRRTNRPVTPIDAVAASGWHVTNNVIADFAKAGGDFISYGGFFKGNGRDNVFERNLVRCAWRHRGGVRVGLSFGGGGTGTSDCAGGTCPREHSGGIIRNNIVMNCSDAGIYLNRSADTLIHNNAIVATRGIDVRFPETDTRIVNNIIDGRILSRDGGRYTARNNVMNRLSAALLRPVSRGIYADPLNGDFRLSDPDAVFDRGTALATPGRDICGQSYEGGAPDIGPIQYRLGLACKPVLPGRD